VNPADIARIALVTDFGAGPYVGQIRARLSQLVPNLPVIDLVQDLPPFRPDLAAYLLPALVRDMPQGTLYLCVVDPGVGGERAGLLVSSEGDWFLGPDNGLLSRIIARRPGAKVHRIGWRPQAVSASFHGRDWFAPAAARLCLGEPLELTQVVVQSLVGMDWPDELPAVVYADRFGNLMCGVRAGALPDGSRIRVKAGGRVLEWARTFCEVVEGQPFWYEDSLGLLEIAVNQGRADRLLGLGPGDPIDLLTEGEAEVARV